MKAIIILFIATIIVANNGIIAYSVIEIDPYYQKFENFKATYNKHYKDEAEEALRFKIFSNELEVIKEHNKSQNVSVLWTVNEFSDWTSDEKIFFVRQLGRRPLDL